MDLTKPAELSEGSNLKGSNATQLKACNQDENDSSILLIRRNVTSSIFKETLPQNDQYSNKEVDEKKKSIEPVTPVICVKQTPIKQIHVRQVNTVKPRIDKIVDNLKINLMQKQENNKKLVELENEHKQSHNNIIKSKNQTDQIPPKVSFVRVANSSKTNENKSEIQIKKEDDTSSLKLSTDYNATLKKDDEEEINDELTNLSWLNTFKLNIIALSPPQSPPLDNKQLEAEDESDGTIHSVNKNKSLRPTAVPVVSKVSNITTATRQSWQLHKSQKQQIPNKVTINQNLFINSSKSSMINSPNNNSNNKKAPVLSTTVNYLAKNIPKRPPYSFSCLTFLAIESSERKRLSVKDIYSWIIQNFPYYGNVPSGSWKNSIRHNLSYNSCFSKVDKNLLAMRDFSGKGSLWCINPLYRPILVDALNTTNLLDTNKSYNNNTSQLLNLSRLPYLQDIQESSVQQQQHQNSKILLTSPPIESNIDNSLPKNKSFNNNNNNSMKKKRFSIQQAKPAIINPKLIANRLESLTPPHITTVMKNSNKKKTLETNKLNESTSDSCSEMDAVNALLSMKSRSSSMPANMLNNVQNSSCNLTLASKSTISSELNVAISQSSANLNTSRGRRKQLFKPPIKRKCNDDNINVVDDDQEVDEDEYNSYDLNDMDDEEERDECAEQDISDISKNFKFDEKIEKGPRKKIKTISCNEHSNTKKSNKLLVKFSCFNKNNNKLNLEKKQKNYEEPNDDHDDDDDAEEKLLQIVEQSDESEKEEGEVTPKRKRFQSNENNEEIFESNNTQANQQAISNNALLELSRAASLIEESKQVSNDLVDANSTTNEIENAKSEIKSIEKTSNIAKPTSNMISTRSKTSGLINTILTRSKTTNDTNKSKKLKQ